MAIFLWLFTNRSSLDAKRSMHFVVDVNWKDAFEQKCNQQVKFATCSSVAQLGFSSRTASAAPR